MHSRRTRFSRALFAAAALVFLVQAASADEPSVSYIFPAGGQRGTTVEVRVGGHYLHQSCGFQIDGDGLHAPDCLARAETVTWFEGPLIPLPDSQQKEDYPWEHAGQIAIDAGAEPGPRRWRVWTSQGVTPSMQFVLGDLPEVIEEEIDGRPIPTEVSLPVTINGRIFPREDVDVWTFAAVAGRWYDCETAAARIGSPLDSRLMVLSPDGRAVAENFDHHGADSWLRFQAATDGVYQVRIEDEDYGGLQHYVYRLTITESESPGRDSIFANVTGTAEQEPNDEIAAAAEAAFPSALDGCIQVPRDRDVWRFTAQKGAAVRFETIAAKLGSPLDSVLEVINAKGDVLAENDDGRKGQSDALLEFTPPADETYYLIVREKFAARGGPEFAYRVEATRLSEAPPDFSLRLPSDAVTVLRGGQAKIKLSVERRNGFAGAIQLRADGLPDGVALKEMEISQKQNDLQLTFESATGAVAVHQVRLIGVGQTEAGEIEREVSFAMPGDDDPTPRPLHLAVAMPTPFKIVGQFETKYAPRGSTYWRRYTIDRGGYEGPLRVRLAERQVRHLQGVTGPEIIVPAGETEFDYPTQLAPWMEIGRTSRTCLMAAAEVSDDEGNVHTVSYTSHEQNDQIIVLVDPGRLDLQLDHRSIMLTPGAAVEIPFRVARANGLSGPVTVRVGPPGHIRGVSAEPVTLSADEDRGVLKIAYAAEAPGPFNQPLTIKAELQSGDVRHIAEAPLEIVGP